ncbi:MAG: molybdopterin-dependent oxidoreductase [bacterium]
MAEIKLIINGKEAIGEKGDSVLTVCKKNDIHVPTLCHHDSLSDTGACRLCLVEIEGQRGYRPACSTVANDGMVVKTDTDEIKKLRRTMLEFLFSERNHFCMFCEASGDCELQKLAYEHGIEHAKYDYALPHVRVDSTRQYFIFDENRCILCQRCIRACSELAGHNVLDLGKRGAESRIIADLNVPFGESTCTSCGTCLQVCPTGALFDRKAAYMGRSYQCETVKSICSACSIGCNIEVVIRDNHIVKINGDWDGQVNKGILCVAGRFEPLNIQKERITKPMIRKNGYFENVNLDEALDLIAKKIKEIGLDNLAGLISQRATNEEAKLFIDMIGKDKVSDLGPVTVPAEKNDGVLDDIKDSDCILVYKVDLDKENRVVGSFVKLSVYKRNAKLVLVDNVNNSLDKHASFKLNSADLNKAREILSMASKPVIIYGKGTDKQEVDKLTSLSDKAKLIELLPGANAKGLRNLGINSRPDINKAKIVYVLACDDDISGKFERGSADFVILHTSYMTSDAEKADIILPSPIWAEKEGTLTNIDGLVQNMVKIINAPETVQSNELIIKSLADRFTR